MLFRCYFILLFSICSTSTVPSEATLLSHDARPKCDSSGVHIDLSNSGIQRLKEYFLLLPQVTCITLENNEIWKMSEKAFANLPNLDYLNLAHNQLPYDHFSIESPTVRTLILDNAIAPTSQEDFEDIFRSSSPCYTKTDHSKKLLTGLDKLVPSKLPKLEKLYLRNNDFTYLSWDPSDFKWNLTHLHLEGNPLHEITLPPSVANLYLSNGAYPGINVRTESAFNHVEVLVLDHNKINTICSPADCRRAKIDNDANYLSATIVHGGLRMLSVASNEMHSISKDTFKKAVNLEYLDLSNNPLKQIPTELFQKLKNLRTLVLNQIEATQVPDCNGLQNLETLTFMGNKIEAIDRSTFKSAVVHQKLKKLNLAGNLIAKIQPNSFDALFSLEELNLSGNKLVVLDRDWIQPHKGLNCLHLGRNLFSNVEDMGLLGVTNINYLNIGENAFEFISVGDLQKLPITSKIIVKPSRGGDDDRDSSSMCI